MVILLVPMYMFYLFTKKNSGIMIGAIFVLDFGFDFGAQNGLIKITESVEYLDTF